MASGAITDRYVALVAEGVVRHDPAQYKAAELLDDICDGLRDLPPRGGLAGFFARRSAVPKGAYIWGDVGRGKSMLMDLFFETVPLDEKRRVHFHEFMDEVHEGIAEFRKSAGSDKDSRDPIPAVIKPIIKSTRLLCLDEFHVQDITNAMLLQRLFERLFGAGLVLVATSNVEPDRLYENGLNRQLFLPFIDLLKRHADVVELEAQRDYRFGGQQGVERFHVGAGGKKAMDQAFAEMSDGAKPHPSSVTSLGREIQVPQAANGVARFSFAALCEAPLGARDYLRLTEHFSQFVIDDVPQFNDTSASAAKRFILLIDTLYDRGLQLAASFAVPISELGGNKDTAFEMQRCVSRLTEMQSEDYIGS